MLRAAESRDNAHVTLAPHVEGAVECCGGSPVAHRSWQLVECSCAAHRSSTGCRRGGASVRGSKSGQAIGRFALVDPDDTRDLEMPRKTLRRNSDFDGRRSDARQSDRFRIEPLRDKRRRVMGVTDANARDVALAMLRSARPSTSGAVASGTRLTSHHGAWSTRWCRPNPTALAPNDRAPSGPGKLERVQSLAASPTVGVSP